MNRKEVIFFIFHPEFLILEFHIYHKKICFQKYVSQYLALQSLTSFKGQFERTQTDFQSDSGILCLKQTHSDIIFYTFYTKLHNFDFRALRIYQYSILVIFNNHKEKKKTWTHICMQLCTIMYGCESWTVKKAEH